MIAASLIVGTDNLKVSDFLKVPQTHTGDQKAHEKIFNTYQGNGIKTTMRRHIYP